MVNVTLLLGLEEASMSFQVTDVPSALATPVALALSGVTLAFGSPKVQVGITVQSTKLGGTSGLPPASTRGSPFSSTGTLSFSVWPKSILNNPAEAGCVAPRAATAAMSSIQRGFFMMNGGCDDDERGTMLGLKDWIL